jgi:hypothetical protein
MNITSTCGKCGQAIEFDVAMAGGQVPCPHCDRLTPAIIPRPDTAPAPAAAVVQARKYRVGLVGVLVVFFAGCALILSGCLPEERNALNQIHSAVQYCTGWLLIAAALILEALRQIARNQ